MPGRERPGAGARGGHRPPGPEARERHGLEGRAREDPRLRAGQAACPSRADAGSGKATLTLRGLRRRDRRLHVPGAGGGPARGLPLGPVLVRLDPLRDGDRRGAFQKKTGVETLSAILNEEPRPDRRAQPGRASDAAALGHRAVPGQGSGGSLRLYAGPGARAENRPRSPDRDVRLFGRAAWVVAPRRIRLVSLLAAAAILAGFLGVFFLGRRAGERPIPIFSASRFGTGRSSPPGSPPTAARSSTAPRGTALRSVSSRRGPTAATRPAWSFADADVVVDVVHGRDRDVAGALARPRIHNGSARLRRAPLAGGAPREMTEAVAGADWSPDGKSLAIVRRVGKTHRLEFPIGKVLYETKDWIETLRFSPAGDRIAFLVRGSDVSVETVDLAGQAQRPFARVEARGRPRLVGGRQRGLVQRQRARMAKRRSTPSRSRGKQRLLMRLPTWIILQDVSRDGRALVSLVALRATIRGLASGETQERDLSWHEGSLVEELTPDGKTLLFDEGNEGYFHTVYVRPMDGSPAKRLGEGRSLAISPDGRWVVANTGGRGSPTVLLPTGAGEPESSRRRRTPSSRRPRSFPTENGSSSWRRDPGHGDRSYVLDLPAGNLRAIGPEGVLLSGRLARRERGRLCRPERRRGHLPRRRRSVSSDSRLQDGRGGSAAVELRWTLPVRRPAEVPEDAFPCGSDPSLRVFRLDLTTGKRELWHEFTPPDRAALLFPLSNFAMTPDGKSYAYSCLNGAVRPLSRDRVEVRRLLGAVGLAVAAASALSQGIPMATLGGLVTAEDGTPIPGVAVRLESSALQGSREATTSPGGRYLLAALPPGDYRVSFTAKGMQGASRTVTLAAAATVRLDQVLMPAAVAESVTVSARRSAARAWPRGRGELSRRSS